MNSTTCIGFSPPGLSKLTAIELPNLRPGTLLIETLFSGVSPGTESRCLRGQQSGVDDHRCITGYQAVGRILGKGQNTEFNKGDIVFFSRAESVDGFINFNGTHSKRVVVQEAGVLPLPEGIKLPEAAMGKITAVAYHGVECAKLHSDETVAVIGLGLLGQLVARIARARGARVVALDRQVSRVAVAREAGIAAFVSTDPLRSSPGVPGDGFDVIFDVTGRADLISQGVALARDLAPWEAPVYRGTRYVVQGSYADSFHFDYTQVFMKELQIIVPRDHFATDLDAALQLIAAGDLMMDNLIGAPVCPSRSQEIYDDLGSANASRLTAVFDWASV